MLCAEKAFSIVEKAMMLETKYGPPEGYTPLLDYVLSYLNEVVNIYYEYLKYTSIVFCINSFLQQYPYFFVHFLSILKMLALSFQLSKIESEENLIKRISLYSLLSTDGSWRSQAVSCLP